MRITKKSLLGLILIVFLLNVCKLTTNASSKVGKDSTGKSEFTASEVNEQYIGGMKHEIVKGEAVTNGAKHNQYINSFTMKTDGVSSKLVTWAVQTSEAGFGRKNIIAAAKDYEKNNPGWIVLGGINADQYFFKYGSKTAQDGSWFYVNCPYYPMVTNGDKLFPISILGNFQNIVGIKNDGSVNSFATTPGIGGFVIEIIDEANNVIEKFPVAGINKAPGAGQTTVWSGRFSESYENKVVDQNVTTSNKLFVVENAELAYLYNSSMYNVGNARDSFFGRGVISATDKTSVVLSKGQFAIETTDEALISKLGKDVRVKVEQEYIDQELNSCKEAIGYHTCHKLNGSEIQTTASYNTQQYSRALIGKKADGTYMLITADMVPSLKSQGLNATEINAVADYYDLVDLYQMDGGGSVTAMIRTIDGNFKVSNFPKDSGNPDLPRENLSYLFFVMRDPGIQYANDDITYHSITLHKQENKGVDSIENIKLNVNGQQYEFKNEEEVTISGLKDNTDYVINVSYDIVNGESRVSSNYDIRFTTKPYSFPENVFTLKNATKTSLTFEKVKSDISDNISNVTIICGGKSYALGNEYELTINDLLEDTVYGVQYTYTIYDEVSKQSYTTTTEKINLSTTSYDVPVIVEFKEYKKGADSLIIYFEYSDSDNTVSNAYILCNEEKIDLTDTLGYQKFSNLDFENISYKFKIVLECQVDDKTFVVESDELVYEKTKEPESEQKPPVSPIDPELVPEPTKKKKCGKKSAELVISMITSISLFALALKKRR